MGSDTLRERLTDALERTSAYTTGSDQTDRAKAEQAAAAVLPIVVAEVEAAREVGLQSNARAQAESDRDAAREALAAQTAAIEALLVHPTWIDTPDDMFTVVDPDDLREALTDAGHLDERTEHIKAGEHDV